MSQEEERPAETALIQKKKPYVTIAVCVFLSVFFMKTGLFSWFYLAPLGYAVFVSGSLWSIFFAAAIVNIVYTLVSYLVIAGDSTGLFINIFYFTSMFLCFIWIMGSARFRTAYRFILASIAGTLVFIVYINSQSAVIYMFLENMAQMVSEMVVSSSGGDAVRNSFLQRMITPEKLIETSKMVFLRGGAVVSILLIFFINRLAVNAAVLIIKKQRNGAGLRDFFAPTGVIWVLSGSLAAVLLTRLIKIEILEILAWNVFVICVILFLAQGAGIFLYMLSRRTYFARAFLSILIILVLFSPLNTVALAALFLLGIAENWLPLRSPKQGQTPTPGL